MHQTFWKPEKKAKEKKVYNSLQYRKPKQKKELPEWKKDILSHHTHRSSTKDRGEFPKEVIAELIAESKGVCQHCKAAEATTTHHVMPRGRKGRGVKSNGLRLCWPCHDNIQTDEELLQYWILVYREKYGDYFWFDEQDWEEYKRKQDSIKASESERAERMEKIQPVVDLLSSGAGRALNSKELRLLECFDEKEISVFTNLMKDVIELGTFKHKVPFGYGYFDD